MYFNICFNRKIGSSFTGNAIFSTERGHLSDQDKTSAQRIILFLFQLQMLCILGTGRLIHHVLFHFFYGNHFWYFKSISDASYSKRFKKIAPKEKSTTFTFKKSNSEKQAYDEICYLDIKLLIINYKQTKVLLQLKTKRISFVL